MPNESNLTFPFNENFLSRSLERNQTVNTTIMSAIKAFLLTEPGQRRGNPIGSMLPALQHKLIPSQALPGLAQELKGELTKQFPGVIFQDVVLTQDLEEEVSNLRVTIAFSTAITNIEQFSFLI